MSESDVQFLERILRERGEASTSEIHIASRMQRMVAMVVNSRAADLRRRGVPVRCRRSGSYGNGRPRFVYWIEDADEAST